MERIVYNPETLSYEVRQLSGWRAVLHFSLMAIGAVAVVAAFCWLWFVEWKNDLPKTALLKIQADAWEARMGVIRHKLDVYEGSLAGIEARNNEVYRSIFALDEISDTSRVDSTLVPVLALDARLNAVQDRIDTQLAALGEVALVAREAGNMVSCIPAVPPILPKKGTYSLSSPFGTRIDPVYGGLARHTGQDFATKVGNPVYATGDGVVEKVDFKFSGYGNEVVVNHMGKNARFVGTMELTVRK